MLDSTAAVAVERQGKSARQLLETVALETGDEEIAVSVITVLELAHGATRSYTVGRRERRQRFLYDLLTGVPIQPITVPIALRAGEIDEQSQARGFRIPLSDLLIGASALELGYRVGTANIRHFQLIPGLSVVISEPARHLKLSYEDWEMGRRFPPARQSRRRRCRKSSASGRPILCPSGRKSGQLWHRCHDRVYSI